MGLLVALAGALRADDFAYMLGTAANGIENPLRKSTSKRVRLL